MAFRVGGRGSSYGPGGVRQLTPRNSGMSNVAQQRLDATVARANEQYLNAIYVDGIEFQLWNRSPRSGTLCTCSLSKDAEVLTQDDEAEDASDFSPVKQRASGLLVRPVLRNDLPDDRVTSLENFSLYDGPEGLDYVDRVISPNLTDTDYGQAELDLDNINASGALSFLDLGEPNHCGICFGTGYTQGYRLHGGQRYVLDASNEMPFDVKGFDLLSHEKPYVFSSNIDSANCVEWAVEFPAYFLKFYEPRVFLNTDRMHVFAVEAKEDGAGNFELLTSAFVERRKGRAYKALVRVRPLQSLDGGTSSVVTFTHVDFVFQTTKWPMLQLPSLSESLDLRTADKIISTNLVLPPTLTTLRREDVLFDFKYRALWKIIGTTDSMTARNQVFGWSADARTILRTDALHALRLILDPVPMDAYQGLVQLQNIHTKPKNPWRKLRRRHGL